MLVLSLDTSTDMLACAVADWMPRADETGADIELLATGDHLCRRRANVELTSTCLDVLARAGHSMSEVDAVLVGRGPGSFTGVRIGIATAKGLACGLGRMLHATSTLDAVAWEAWRAGVRGLLGVVGDAMRGEVYPGIYQVSDAGPVRTFAVETVSKVDACIEAWASRQDAREMTLTGDGLKKYRDRFEAAGFSLYVEPTRWYPTGEGLLRAAASPSRYDAHETGDPALVLPVYTRLSDAEENERKRLGLVTPASLEVTGVDEALADRHLQLRPMSMNDLDTVVALESAAYEGTTHTPWGRRLFDEELAQPDRSWWVAHDLGRIVGFAGGQMAGDDFEISDVVVGADHRRRGIAARLVSRICYDAHVLNARTASLEVGVDNDAGRATYASLGFAEVGRRSGYYGEGHDALILRVALPLETDAEHALDHVEPAASIRPWPIVAGSRTAACRQALADAGPLVLSIESSCDETAMAITDAHGAVCASVVATSIDFHARFGGVVPEIASRKHVEAIVGVFEETLAKAGEHFGCDTLAASDLAAVGVTAGPGLVGALVVGVAFAKGLCAAADLPLVPVHHLEGHLLANLFETPDLEPPFVASLVSGGNTMLVHVRAWGDYEILGTTIDDAVGEAFDKVSKALGLGYPGGPVISRLAAQGNPRAIHFPRAMLHSGDYSFSLSGLKTAVITYIEGENRAGRSINLADLAASFEAAVIDVQVAKAVTAVEQTGVSDFCVGGGVAANPDLRAAYKDTFGKMGVRVTVPPMRACGDNAAMIGIAALRSYRADFFAPLTLDAQPNAPLGSWSVSDAPVCPSWEK